MKYAVVTTFSQEGYEKYGKRFVESYRKYWPKDVPLYIFHEGSRPKGRSPKNINWIEFKSREREEFLKSNIKPKGKSYKWDYKRFCHKVFALELAADGDARDVDWLIWLDADIETLATIDEDFLKQVCPEGFTGSYLGRKDWPHSECGFVAFNLRNGGLDTIKKWASVYTSGELFTMDEWHDSWVFDQIREGWWFNLSENISGMHVFDDSILGTRMRHDKGPLRKEGLNSNTPGYQSQKEKGNGKQKLLVKTKNCVPDLQIQGNIHYNCTFIEKWLPQCKRHNGVAVFCSGGPSLKEYIKEIKELSKKKDHYIVCVKHAHDFLIENGVIPWACILLDPRSHVQDFVENPHPGVRYFIASMCHPTTLDALREKGARYWGYHAHVGAGEKEVIASRFKDHHMVGGGCAAATRGFSVLHMLGFRSLKLYGYDLCYFEDVDWEEKTKTGDKKYMEVEILGRKFVTDAEKIAQAQDFEKAMKAPEELEIEAFGPGIIPHMWQATSDVRPDFRDILNA